MTHADPGGAALPRDESALGPDGAERVTPYDELRYPGKFYPQASPEWMATLATLFGLTPAPVERCRVLELGCGEGGHLLPLAYVLPQSQFIGVDLSQLSIARAAALAVRLGVENAAFRVEDLTRFPADAGEFDYIIAHGVYSWVPPEAQAALLAISARHLAPHGVAYVSYNTYPGAHLRNTARDLTLFHTRAIADPVAKGHAAHAILDLVLAAMPERSLERQLLANIAARYKVSTALTRFDLLSEANEPAYFLDFMEQAAAAGLQFLAESDVNVMRSAELPEPARLWLEALPDRLLREQYLDFIRWRGFRSTLLCRAERSLDLEVTPARMERLLVTSSLKPTTAVIDLALDELVEFRSVHGHVLSCREAMPKAVYLELGEAFPRALPYPELRARTCARLGLAGPLEPALEAKLIRMLVASLANGVAGLHVYRSPFRTDLSERPVASAVGRAQAESEGPVSSMYLASFQLGDPLMRALLPLLDGSRDRSQLERELAARLEREHPGAVTRESMERALTTLAAYGMLIG